MVQERHPKQNRYSMYLELRRTYVAKSAQFRKMFCDYIYDLYRLGCKHRLRLLAESHQYKTILCS